MMTMENDELSMYKEVIKKIREAINSLPEDEEGELSGTPFGEPLPSEADMKEVAATARAVENLRG